MTAFITGASSGFGSAIARKFVAAGKQVVLAARREDRLAALAEELGDHAHVRVLDVRNADAIRRTIDDLPPELADIDCLVNNAGLALGLGAAPVASLDDWDEMIATNCTGLVHVTRAVLPGMVARKRGLIVNLGSVAGTYPYPGGNVYGASKAFVHQFSANLRTDLHGSGVRVSCVEPGMCSGSEFSLVRFGGDRARADAVYTGFQPLTADDIADVVLWIASTPAHVNVNSIELMPVAQSVAGFQVHRG